MANWGSIIGGALGNIIMPGAGAAIGAGLGGMFDKNGKPISGGGGGGSVNTQTFMPEWQEGLGQDLSSWVSKFIGMYNPGQPYGGAYPTTQPTDLEKMGLGELGGLLGRPATGDLFSAAKGNVMDTLSGKFADPATSPFIQAMTKLSGQNLQDSINTARGQRGARGTFFTKAGIQEESRLGERSQNFLNTIIGEFMNNERGRQQTAVGQARDLEGFETDTGIKRVAASQTLGNLSRMLEMGDYERKYNDWLNQRKELSAVPGVGQGVFNQRVPMSVSTTQPRPQTSGNDIAPWIDLAMKMLPMFGGG